ncbi:MAG: glycosyltransferase [Anaerolineae bacterium]|nr:glycosyltransferase [Anaerolineae bacterium]
MHIGMVTAIYKPVVNGVTRMVELYREHLEAAGYEVTIFTLGAPDPSDDDHIIRSPGFQVSDRGYYLTPGFSREAQKLMRQMDILHSHHLIMGVEMAHRYGRCPVIYTNHTRYDLYGNAILNLPQSAADAILRQLWPDFCDYADLVIAPSESVRQIMLDFGVRAPTITIENGVELQPFHQPPNPRRKADFGLPDTAVLLLYVGRLAAEKNLDSLIDQFAIAADVAPHLHLMLVGDGLSREMLVAQVNQMELQDRVHFTGPVPVPEVPNYMAAADIFVTASVSEVHPLTVIEAMAAGLPVVAVSSPGISDSVVSGHTGLLTTRPDGGLAAAMVGLALNPERRAQMSAAARAESDRYDIRRTVALTQEVYERLHAERPDLKRKQQHGRRYLYRQRVQSTLDRIFKPEEREHPLPNWLAPEFWLRDRRDQHDQWK